MVLYGSETQKHNPSEKRKNSSCIFGPYKNVKPVNGAKDIIGNSRSLFNTP